MSWDDLHIALVLARQGTLSAAARHLGLTHATIARRLAAVEGRLGRALFERDRTGYRITRFGDAVLAQARIMDEAALAIGKLADASPALAGTVRLTTARAMANGYLAKRLADLVREHPGLEITLLADSKVLSLAHREADIAIRLGRPRDADLVGSHVADIEYGFYASAALRAALDVGARPTFIGFDKDDPTAEGIWLASHFADALFTLRTNSHLSQVEAARSGAGIALLPHYLASGLEPVLLGDTPPAREVWLITRRDLANVPRFRVVMDYLAKIYRADRRVFARGED